jgi:phosphohistidine phosphatase
LSDEGREDVRRLADFLRHAGVRVEQIWHSGKTRAEQTAALLADAMLTGGSTQARSGLNPNDPVEPIGTAIETWSSDTMLVGHLPFLGRLASLLLTSDGERSTLAFAPGSTACLERDAAGQWVLCWMLRPELLTSQSVSG